MWVSVSSRPAWSTELVPGQSGLHKETLKLRKKRNGLCELKGHLYTLPSTQSAHLPSEWNSSRLWGSVLFGYWDRSHYNPWLALNSLCKEPAWPWSHRDSCCKERACLFFPAARLVYTRNNHTETVFIKSLLGLLALTSYWLTLTSWFSPFLLIYVSPHGCVLSLIH